jgi:hypothetical protein
MLLLKLKVKRKLKYLIEWADTQVCPYEDRRRL